MPMSGNRDRGQRPAPISIISGVQNLPINIGNLNLSDIPAVILIFLVVVIRLLSMTNTSSRRLGLRLPRSLHRSFWRSKLLVVGIIGIQKRQGGSLRRLLLSGLRGTPVCSARSSFRRHVYEDRWVSMMLKMGGLEGERTIGVK